MDQSNEEQKWTNLIKSRTMHHYVRRFHNLFQVERCELNWYLGVRTTLPSFLVQITILLQHNKCPLANIRQHCDDP